jgi:hypothetical protein
VALHYATSGAIVNIMLDTETVLILAAKSGCDPRTAARALRGEAVRGLAGSRLRRALAELGIAPAMGISSAGELVATDARGRL